MHTLFSFLPAVAFNFKIGFINISIALLLIWLLVQRLRSGKKIVDVPFWFYLFLLFWFAELVSFLFSPYDPPVRRIFGDLWRSVSIIAGYWWMSNRRMDRRLFFITFWTLAGLIAIYGIGETIVVRHGLFGTRMIRSFRTAGFSGNPMTYSGILIIVFATLLTYLLYDTRGNFWSFRKVGMVILMLIFVVSGFNGTRSGILGIFFATFVLFILRFKAKGVFLALLIVSIVASLLVFTPVGFRWKVAFKTISNGEIKANSSEGTRLMLWKFAIEKFRERPVVGNGPGTFKSVVSREPYADKLESLCHAHNNFLQVLYESGLLGFFPFVLFWFYPVYFFLRRGRDLFWGYYPVAIVSGLLVAGLFECNLFDAEVVMTTYFLIGMAFKYTEEGEEGYVD